MSDARRFTAQNTAILNERALADQRDRLLHEAYRATGYPFDDDVTVAILDGFVDLHRRLVAGLPELKALSPGLPQPDERRRRTLEYFIVGDYWDLAEMSHESRHFREAFFRIEPPADQSVRYRLWQRSAVMAGLVKPGSDEPRHQEVCRFGDQLEGAKRLSWSRDRQVIVCAETRAMHDHDDRNYLTIHRWDAASGQPPGPATKPAPCDLYALSNNARLAIVSGVDGQSRSLEVRDIASDRTVQTVKRDGYPLDVEFSPDDQQFAVATAGNAALYDCDGGKRVWNVAAEPLGRDDSMYSRILFAPDGKQVVLMRQTSYVVVDAVSGAVLTKGLIPQHAKNDSLEMLSLTADGKRAFIAMGSSLVLFDLGTGQFVDRWPMAYPCLAVSGDDRYALCGTHHLSLVDLQQGLEIARWTSDGGKLDYANRLGPAIFSPDNRLVLTAGTFHDLHCYPVPSEFP